MPRHCRCDTTQSPSPYRCFLPTQTTPPKDVATHRLGDVVVPSFASPNRQDLDAFATAIQTVIAQVEFRA